MGSETSVLAKFSNDDLAKRRDELERKLSKPGVGFMAEGFYAAQINMIDAELEQRAALSGASK